MAGVEHAYQYSVEVKSRFSLFLDDSLNNEDPDLLISKIQHERSRKDKPITNRAEPKQAEQPPIVKSTEDSVPVQDSKPLKPLSPVSPKPEPTQERDDKATYHQPALPRGRGEGFRRGFRGRGRGNHVYHDSPLDQAGDSDTRSNFPPEPRGRGRGRFFRGRGQPYTDYREFNNQGLERSQPKYGYHGDGRTPEQQVLNETEPSTESAVVEHTDEAAVESPSKPEETEEEPKTYTLEEYKAMRSSSKPVVTLATKGPRKANDGKDVFKDMIAHRKIVEVNEDKENEAEPVDKGSQLEDKFEINVSFTDRLNDRDRPNRGFGGRGFGRGRGPSGYRGGRARGGSGPRSNFRGDRGRGGFSRGTFSEHKATPVIHSDQDFPSLK